MKKKTIARKIISMVLVFCMVFELLPLSAWAAEAQTEREIAEQVAMYMLDFGLVDEQGNMIYDNSFTLEDGTKLANLDELLDWLIECDDDELSTLITVDATGKVATAEWIIEAIAIETDMEILTGKLNRIAGTPTVTNLQTSPADSGSAAVSDAQLAMHSLSLIQKVSGWDTDTVTFQVGLVDPDESYSGEFVAVPNDVTIESGLFCDFKLEATSDTPVQKDGNIILLNKYYDVTLSKGQKYVEYKLDLADIRELLNNTPDNDEATLYDYAGVQYNYGLWGGAVPAMFQSRVVGGAKAQSTNTRFYIAKQAQVNDAAHLAAKEKKSGVNSLFYVAKSNSGTAAPFVAALSNVGTETVNGVEYYKMEVGEISGVLGSDSGGTAQSLNDALTAIYNATGHNNSMTVTIESGAVVTGKKQSETTFNSHSLYIKDDYGAMQEISSYMFTTAGSDTSKQAKLQRMAAAVAGKWAYAESDSLFNNMKLYYEGLLKGDSTYVVYSNLKVPTLGQDRSSGRKLPTTFYVKKDWLKKGSDSVAPTGFLLWGKINYTDSTAPTVATYDGKAAVSAVGSNFRAGDVVPITVTFTEPVYGYLDLKYGNDGFGLGNAAFEDSTVYGTVKPTGNSSIGVDNATDIARQRTFYYTLQPGDTGVKLVGVNQMNLDGVKDMAGNAMSAENTFDEAVIVGDVQALSIEDGVDKITVDYPAGSDPLKAKVTVKAQSGTMYNNLFANYKNGDKKFKLVVDWDRTTPLKECTLYDVEMGEGGDEYGNKWYTFTADLDLSDDDKGKTRTVELVIEDNYTHNYSLYWGACDQFAQRAVEYADSSDYEIKVSAAGWPSEQVGTVYAEDYDTPVFSYEDKGASYTYKNFESNTLEWKSSDEKVVTLVPVKDGSGYTVVAQGAGTAKIYLQCNNAGKKDTVASNEVEIKVVAGSSPALMIPKNANTVTTRADDALQVAFYSNLNDENVFDSADTQITAKLYEGNELPAADAKEVWSDKVARTATNVTIPEGKLSKISVNGEAAYTLVLTANAKINEQRKDLQTVAYIVVNSQPAVVTLRGLDNPMFAHTDNINIGWTVANFDLENNADNCRFEFTVEKDGLPIHTDTTKQASGSYTLNAAQPGGLKDTYLVTVRAKNGTDPTWSVASSTVTVYNKNALKMWVNGTEKSKITLKNEVGGNATTTNPTINTYSGKHYDGLVNAAAIAALRTELSLMETVSVNYGDYNWSLLYDTIKWTSENVNTGQTADETDDVQKVVSINYRQSAYYEPLENFSYLYYVPETIMMLCGLADGTAKVTARHSSVDSLKAELTVDVNRLKNKLYLFQFTPAEATNLYYVDGAGNEHYVTSNADGSLALYEPNGIAGDLRLGSVSGGVEYRSTVDVRALRSGEGNGVESELYPLNAIELTKGAVAEFTLLKPDGTPLANTEITVRGGVYRNPEDATRRDDAYCENAGFTDTLGASASWDGKKDMKFETNANGVVTVRMDSKQFTSELDSGEVEIGDNFRFIFEVRFANDEYNPEIVVIDTGMTYKDTIRTGNNLLTLTKADGKKPLVVVQTVDYFTGRDIDVRRHTGVVGPSADYPALELSTQLMLWGVDGVTTADTGYRFDVRAQETAVKLPNQQYKTARDVSYPFSSIPLLENVTTINEDSFGSFKATKRIPMELVLYKGDGSLSRTVSLPFGLVDLSAIDKVSEDQSLIDLLGNLAIWGNATGEVGYDENGQSNKGNTLKGVASDIIDVIDSLKNVGSKMGLVRTVLMPTADPTIFSAYIWTGYDTTEMADLRYDEHGIYMEPTHIFQSEDQMSGTFFGQYTMSDFRAMSDGTYHEKWQDDNSDIAGLLFGDGKVMQGWMNAEICYNFDKAKWEVITTGGGFTFGKQIEVGGRAKQRFKPFPYNYKITARGGIVVSLEMAVRYAEQLGNEWNDETAKAVNDWLTTIRVNAYIEAYAGLGIDKGLVMTVGVFGNVEMNNENRILRRSYLASDKKLSGSYLQLDGELGIRETVGIGPLTVEWVLVSIKLGDQWRFRSWNEIDQYWQEASSGYSTGWINAGGTAGYSLQADYGGQTAIAAGTGGVKLQSRDYLADGEREWYGGSALATMSLDDTNKLQNLQSNSYPLSRPLVSDDGEILVYLSDNDSTDVEQVEVRYSLLGEGGQMYPVGTAIPGPADFAGYGDSSLDFDGDSNHAGAVWLREAATLGLKAGADVTLSQQLALVNGLDVVAAIWDGDSTSWTTTRLTDNAAQEMSPVIAVAADGDAIVAWRAVQNSQQTDEYGDLQMDFGDSRILYKLYDHETKKWSDTAYTLYNGSAGSVKGLSIEMAGDTAAVAFVLDNGVAAAVADGDTDTDLSGSEIYYAVINTAAQNVEDETKTVRATTNTYLDENPQLAAVGDKFVLGWRTMQTEAGVEQNDVALRVFGANGAPVSVLPESLSNMVSTESFNGQFTFVKGATSLDGLSLLWNDAAAGGENNDVIRAIKFGQFGQYGGAYAASAPIEVAALPENTYLTHIDASAIAGDESVHAVMQANTYTTNTEAVALTVDLGGEEYNTTANVPTETSGLYSATGSYADSVAVIGTNVDYSSLAANAPVPVTFTVENQGLHAISKLTLTVNGVPYEFNDVNLLLGKTQVLSVVVNTGATISDMSYTLKADFVGAQSQTDTGTLYLDYPDVGISSLRVIKEQDGARTFIATMYNQAAASLTSGTRRVVLGVYSDSECEKPLDRKYFAGSNTFVDTAGTGFEIVIDGANLAVIDDDNFAKDLTFDIAGYVADYAAAKNIDLKEIPEQGVRLFVKARVEQLSGSAWQELPEADEVNNQKSIAFDSLLARNNDEPTTMSVEMSEVNGKAQATVQVRNNSLQARNDGHLLATLVNANGGVVETVNVADVDLDGEEQLSKTVNFSTTGSRVVLSYGDAVADTTTAEVKSITIDGLPLTLDSFDAEGKATVSNVPRGTYVLTVATKSTAAKVTVNGVAAENGIAEVQAGGTYTIVVTSADGTDEATYTVYLQRASSGGHGGATVTAPEQTNPAETGDNPFADVKLGDWFYDNVLYAYQNGLMKGTDEQTFEPNSPTTRGMIVTILYRLAGAPTVTAANPFKDVKAGAYYEDAITWAAENGVVTGYDEATFGPDDSITREQMAAILWRYAKLNDVDVSVGEDTNILSYDDGMMVAEYAVAAMQWACGAGIINGVTASTLEPQGRATRAQVAAILQRYCENVPADK